MTGKLDASKVTSSTTVTEMGYAADARQLNPAVAGSLAEKIKKLNGVYTLSKALKIDEVYTESQWTEIKPFSYTLPKRSAVIMSATFSYLADWDGVLDMFVANSYYRFQHKSGEDARVQMSRSFIADANFKMDCAVGARGGHRLTIRGSDDQRYSRVEYTVFPLE